MNDIEIVPVGYDHYAELAVMAGELLEEIMRTVGARVFHFDPGPAAACARELIEAGSYRVYLAREQAAGELAGFVSMYEGFALYTGGAFGTIPELYVRPAWRSRGLGARLLQQARAFAASRDWRRLEVTTPPLPWFERTVRFYEANGFEVTGGRKLKLELAR